MVGLAKVEIAQESNKTLLADYFAWAAVAGSLVALALIFVRVNKLMSKAMAF
jgi:hypothetical protein